MSILSDLLIHLVDLAAEKLSSAIDFDAVIAGLSSKDGSSAGSSASDAATTTATAAPAAK